MLNEIVLKVNLGCKLLAGHLVVGRLGCSGAQSLVAISHTLDKIVVHDTSVCWSATGSLNSRLDLTSNSESGYKAKDDSDGTQASVGELATHNVGADATYISNRQKAAPNQQRKAFNTSDISPSVYYIAVRDVIRSISVKNIKVLSRPNIQVNNLAASKINNNHGKRDPPEKQEEKEAAEENEKEQHQQKVDEKKQSVNLSAHGTTSTSTTTNTTASKHSNLEQVHTNAISEDLLLIGCSNSMLVYDSLNSSNLSSLNTTASIDAISCPSFSFFTQELDYDTSQQAPSDGSSTTKEAATTTSKICADQLTVCGGSQRLYILKFELNHLNGFHVELSSGRSTEDSVSCIAQGKFIGMQLVITGCVEERIRVYQLDLVDENIQTCKLTIVESSKINCLCPINTAIEEANTNTNVQPPAGNSNSTTTATTTIAAETNQQQQNSFSYRMKSEEQMNYFSYGLENGLIGVYRLLARSSASTEQKVSTQQRDSMTKSALSVEPSWKQKCKYIPLTMVMYDINGDGLDELMIGFTNGRIEARSPFTGQLLAATRCFKSSDRLVGLVVLDYNQDGRSSLIACSTSGSLVGFRASTSKPRLALKGYDATRFSSKATPNNQRIAELSLTGTQTTTTNNLKTIAEEQDYSLHTENDLLLQQTDKTTTSSHKREEDDLHIESSSSSLAAAAFPNLSSGTSDADYQTDAGHDNSKARSCLAKQNFELLQRICLLQNEQLELEKKACRIYHANVYQASRYHETDISIAHKWDFVPSTVSLKLTIVISTQIEEIKLIHLTDQSKNLITTGHRLLMEPNKGNQGNKNNHDSNMYEFEMSMQCEKNLECKLELEIFCEPITEKLLDNGTNNNNNNNSTSSLSRIHHQTIHVPKYSMFTFAPQKEEIITTTETSDYSNIKNKTLALLNSDNDEQNNYVHIKFSLKDESKVRQVLDWLGESFLCFQFGQLLSCDSSSSSGSRNHSHIEGVTSTNKLSSFAILDRLVQIKKNSNPNLSYDYDNKNFELNLIDMRQTLKKMAADEKEEENGSHHEKQETTTTTTSTMINGNNNIELHNNECKFFHLASMLRITHFEGLLELSCQNSDLAVELVQSLMIDRLNLDLTSLRRLSEQGEYIANISPLLNELTELNENMKAIEESGKRIQTELYESADHTKNLMQQFAIANELNEFSTAKDLLNEMSIMLAGIQNAARTHCLNSRRPELDKRLSQLKEKIVFLSGQQQQLLATTTIN